MSTQDGTKQPEVKEVEQEKKPDQKEAEKTEEKPADGEEKTLGEVIETKPEEKPNKKPDNVPFEVFEMSKKENKELRKTIADLQKKVADGADAEEISADIDAIAEEFKVDKTFLRKMEKALMKKATDQLSQEVAEKMKPFDEEKSEKKKTETFNSHLDTVLENKPEFKAIINREVIKSLAFLPQNAKKTLSQLLEETYGNAIGGKRTIETTTPRGGKDPQKIDFDKARNDPEYFKEVLADPELKRQYNENLEKRVYY